MTNRIRVGGHEWGWLFVWARRRRRGRPVYRLMPRSLDKHWLGTTTTTQRRQLDDGLWCLFFAIANGTLLALEKIPARVGLRERAVASSSIFGIIWDLGEISVLWGTGNRTVCAKRTYQNLIYHARKTRRVDGLWAVGRSVANVCKV